MSQTPRGSLTLLPWDVTVLYGVIYERRRGARAGSERLGVPPVVQSLKETREMLMEPPHPYLILIPCCSLMLPHLVRSKEA